MFKDVKDVGKPGKFELAHSGTVFLDEIGDMPLEMQPKPLRVLEDKEFERIGGNTVIRSDFRLIAATNQDLDKMIAGGRFRKDLFYHLNVISIHIPPLRERKRDIIPIARHLLRNLSEEATLPDINLAKETETLLKTHDWPGNVREISNVLERALSTLDDDTIEPDHLPFYNSRGTKRSKISEHAWIKEAQARVEKTAILRALEEADYKKTRTADMLGIHRTLLYKKLVVSGKLKPWQIIRSCDGKVKSSRVSTRTNYTRLRGILVRLQGTSADAYRDLCWWM